jgi:protein-S-isoprenylcysteine O-methyltransferase Ste14
MSYLGTYLLLYFLIYFGVAFVWRSVKVFRATGIQPIRLPHSDDAHGYVGRMFKGVLVLSLAYLCGMSFVLDVRQALPPIAWLDKLWMQVFGWLVLISSGAVLVSAQAHMGSSWRIGLDADTPGPLVVHGLFARSRNPIFCPCA